MTYQTISKPATAEYIEKRSRFIGYIKPITTVEQANQFIEQVKSENYDAKHVVFAYVLRNGNIERYSDAGEPQGTAGMPTLDVLRKSGVTDAIIVTVRYFGGILLGGGGLVRAYSKAASEALQCAGILTMKKCMQMKTEISYNQNTPVTRIINSAGAIITDTDYSENVTIYFSLSNEKTEDINNKIIEATNGQSDAKILGEIYMPVEE